MNFKQEWNLWLIALTFYTRISIWQPSQYDSALLPKANRYFTLVGILIGGLVGCVGWTIAQFFPVTVAATCLVFAGVLLTGAFHEDGLADTFDAMGAWSIEKRLAVMKDSRIGTYGSCALIATILLRVVLWSALPVSLWVPAAVIVHSTSRLLPLFLVRQLHYVREDQNSKVKPVAQQIEDRDLLLASVWVGVVLAGLFALAGVWAVVSVLVALVALSIMLIRWLNRFLGGYTGDQLGAAQQMGEWLILAICVQVMA